MILTHSHLRTTNIVQRRKLKTKSNPFMIDLIYGPSFKSYICQLNWSFLKGESLFGKVMYILLYLKWITNKNLLYSTWNSAQCYVAAWVGGNFRGKWIHGLCMAESLHCSPGTITILLTGYTPIQSGFLCIKKIKFTIPKKKGGSLILEYPLAPIPQPNSTWNTDLNKRHTLSILFV